MQRRDETRKSETTRWTINHGRPGRLPGKIFKLADALTKLGWQSTLKAQPAPLSLPLFRPLILIASINTAQLSCHRADNYYSGPPDITGKARDCRALVVLSFRFIVVSLRSPLRYSEARKVREIIFFAESLALLQGIITETVCNVRLIVRVKLVTEGWGESLIIQ